MPVADQSRGRRPMVYEVFYVCLLTSLATSFLQFWAAPAIHVVSFTKPEQTSLWITADVSTGFNDNHFFSFTTNKKNDVIMPFQGKYIWPTSWMVYGLGDRWSARANLDAAGSPYDFIRRFQKDLPVYNEFIRKDNNQSLITFAGFNSSKPNEWIGLTDTRKLYVFAPYNASGCIIDYTMTGINFGNGQNFTVYAGNDFQFADDSVNWLTGLYNWRTQNTTASWNSTMQAMVASSTSQSGYGAMTSRLRSDTNGTWTFSYSIWNSSSDFFTWMADKRVMDNATHGSLPTISTNVFTSLCYNNTSTTTGIYSLHFSVYIAFGGSLAELNNNLNDLMTITNTTQNYEDSNTYWYNTYTANSAVDFNNDNLNKMYYWSKHLSNVGHYGKRYFSAGANYHSGYVDYAQDSAEIVASSMSSGLWCNVLRYLTNRLTNGIAPAGYTYDGFGTGEPYSTDHMMTWTITMYAPSGERGTVRASVDFLNSVAKYISWSGNTTFASNNWANLTRMIEAVHNVTTDDGILPLTNGMEDTDSSLGCNVIYYQVLKSFSAISNKTGNSSYATTLNTRASILKTQLNTEIGFGGLWSTLNGYFVNGSSVSFSDTNPKLWLMHNAEAVTHDLADSDTKKASILSAIENKLENAYGFYDNQFLWTMDNTTRIWSHKLYELAKAYANMDNASKINKIVWSHVSNPYCGLLNQESWTRFNFPEYWMVNGTTYAYDLQYAFSSTFCSIAIDVLFGVNPSIESVKIQPIKPSNISKVTVMNLKVRDALWNISVSGGEAQVTNLIIDGTYFTNATIPSTYYTGNHTIQVSLLKEQLNTIYLTETLVGATVVTVVGVVAAYWYRRKKKTRRRVCHKTKQEKL